MCQPAVVAAAGPGSAGAEGATDSVVNPVLKRDYTVLCFLLFPPAVKEDYTVLCFLLCLSRLLKRDYTVLCFVSCFSKLLKRDYTVLCFLLFPPAVKEGLHCTLLSVVSASC